MSRAILASATEADLALLGAAIGLSLKPGDCLLLEGPIGAGKTHLARAAIRAWLGDRAADVPSPSFPIVQTYERGERELAHIDLYRLERADLTEFAPADPEAITIIEWPDRLATLPAHAATLALTAPSPETRTMTLDGEGDFATRVTRCAEITAFLRPTATDVTLLAGDASTRRYLRTKGPDASRVLMDAEPGTCGPYLAMTEWLRARHFHAPEIILADPDRGLLLLEDLGDDLLYRHLDRHPQDQRAAYLRLTDLLIDLHRHTSPSHAPALDGTALAAQVEPFTTHYLAALGAAGEPLGPIIAAIHARTCANTPPVLALRDLHAENLIWHDTEPFGLLDFQDAVATHPAYDLASALQDVRCDIPAEIEDACITHYLAATGLAAEPFRAAYALLGTQRNLRILGIFTRLAIRDGKPRYLAFMPRCWSLIERNLAHPALAPLASALATAPRPTPDAIARIRSQCQTP